MQRGRGCTGYSSGYDNWDHERVLFAAREGDRDERTEYSAPTVAGEERSLEIITT